MAPDYTREQRVSRDQRCSRAVVPRKQGALSAVLVLEDDGVLVVWATILVKELSLGVPTELAGRQVVLERSVLDAGLTGV